MMMLAQQTVMQMLAPELVMTVGAAVVLVLGLSRTPGGRASTGFLTLATILVALAMAWYAGPVGRPERIWGIEMTSLTWYVRLIALGIGLLVVLVHWNLPAETERGDTFGMILFSLTGILLTSLADDLVMLFLAVELVSVPGYILVSIGRSDIRAQEAGVKYFFLGAMSAALMAYGFSFMYGAAGTTLMSQMQLAHGGGHAVVGLLLAFCGLAFKLSAVPFHVYAPDVYQGAASPVTGLLGFFPKIGGLLAIIKLIATMQPLGVMSGGWHIPEPAFWFLWLVAALTMTVGNVVGLMQSNVKRILAYSSIAHAGYILIGVLVGPARGGSPFSDGLAASLFYVAVYGLMNLGAFAVLSILESRGQSAEELDDLAGLARRAPMAALAMVICIFSLMGMPPTAGFIGKVYVFGSALAAGDHPHYAALVVLAVIGFLNSAIGAAYYLWIISAMYLREPVGETRVAPGNELVRLGLAACCVIVLIFGIWPNGLMHMARQSFLRGAPATPQTIQDTTAQHQP